MGASGRRWRAPPGLTGARQGYTLADVNDRPEMPVDGKRHEIAASEASQLLKWEHPRMQTMKSVPLLASMDG
jgi:hypothetical protein